MNEARLARRVRCLRALGVEPLRLRRRLHAAARVEPALAVAGAPVHDAAAAPIRRLALQPDPAELAEPAIKKMYTALTEAVSKAGLQAVRVCDVADDPAAAVVVFGAAPPPAGVPGARVVRADALATLAGDRERKRALWERMLAIGRHGTL